MLPWCLLFSSNECSSNNELSSESLFSFKVLVNKVKCPYSIITFVLEFGSFFLFENKRHHGICLFIGSGRRGEEGKGEKRGEAQGGGGGGEKKK